MNSMRIGIVAKLRQGDLMEALEKRRWTQKQAADFLGIHLTTFNQLINLKWIPKKFTAEFDTKIFELTGKTSEELFPEWTRQEDFLKMPKVSKRMIEAMPLMIQTTCPQFLLMGPEEARCAEEAREIIDNTLETALSPKEEQVIRRTVMDDEPDEVVGMSFNLTKARIGQIRKEALSKLRHPVNYRKMLKCFQNIVIS